MNSIEPVHTKHKQRSNGKCTRSTNFYKEEDACTVHCILVEKVEILILLNFVRFRTPLNPRGIFFLLRLDRMYGRL